VKTKIEDLTDEQLDYFCAIAQGWKEGRGVVDGLVWYDGNKWHKNYHPTANAAQCMEIMEGNRIGVTYNPCDKNWVIFDITNKLPAARGNKVMQAIIRCFVKSKLGEEVDCEQ